MTKASQSSSADVNAAPPATDGGEVCGKCGHENKAHASKCAECDSHLHIVCHQCGHRNLRTVTACVECGKHLHQGFAQRLMKRVFRRSPDIAPFQIGFLILAVYLGYRLIIWISQYNLPMVE